MINFVTSSLAILAAASLSFSAAAKSSADKKASVSSKEEKIVRIDGSSTVYPLSEALAEEFQKANKGSLVTVATSGTGGGIKKFVAGEIDIANASRPIKTEEAEAAKKAGITFTELEIAIDGLAVMVHKDSKLNSITTAQLKKIWEPGSAVKQWKDVDASWSATPIKLYGPGTDSGTFDYFTEVVVGKAKASRPDYTASEDDNVLVRGLSQDKNGLGYFGYGYFVNHQDKLKALAIDAGKGPITPSAKTIEDGTYAPLSRPLYIYVNMASAKREAVAAFVSFTLKNVATYAKEVGYVPLPAQKTAAMSARWQATIGKATAGK